MKPKTILTVVILAFVAAAVGYLVAKEIKRAKVPEVAREGVSEPTPVATGEHELETAEAGTAAAPAKVGYGDEASEEGTTPSAPDRKVVVTYYYTSKR
jgi:hypothetical protein